MRPEHIERLRQFDGFEQSHDRNSRRGDILYRVKLTNGAVIVVQRNATMMMVRRGSIVVMVVMSGPGKVLVAVRMRAVVGMRMRATDVNMLTGVGWFSRGGADVEMDMRVVVLMQRSGDRRQQVACQRDRSTDSSHCSRHQRIQFYGRHRDYVRLSRSAGAL